MIIIVFGCVYVYFNQGMYVCCLVLVLQISYKF